MGNEEAKIEMIREIFSNLYTRNKTFVNLGLYFINEFNNRHREHSSKIRYI